MVDLSHHKVLLVGKTPSLTWLSVRALNRVGVRPYVLSAMRFHLGSLINRSIRVESFDPEEMMSESGRSQSSDQLSAFADKLPRKVAEFCTQYGISLVLPIDLPTIIPISDAQGWLSERGIRVFPVAPSDVIRELHDKWAFSKLCERLNLDQPDTRRLDRFEDVQDLDLVYPLIVKPLNRANSAGIRVVSSPGELQAYLSEKHLFNQLPLLVQKYIPGRDMGFSLLADRGEVVAWTCFHQHRLRRHFIDRPDLLEGVQRLVAETAFHGIGHIDFRLGEDGVPRYLEINPRVWGSLLYSVNAGMNFLELGLRMALGESVKEAVYPVDEAWVGVALKDRLLSRANYHLAQI